MIFYSLNDFCKEIGITRHRYRFLTQKKGTPKINNIGSTRKPIFDVSEMTLSIFRNDEKKYKTWGWKNTPTRPKKYNVKKKDPIGNAYVDFLEKGIK